jgi:hypothetical protein
MTENERKFSLYSIALRFLVYKITNNLRRIYLDVDLKSSKMLFTAVYFNKPSELELELLDDIVTNTNAHIPDLFVEYNVKLSKEFLEEEKHDFLVFAVYEDYDLKDGKI